MEANLKPTRDVNAPETTEEVRRDAFKQEMEKKRQINNLPPLGTMGDQRGGPFRRQAPGSQPVIKGDWNTVQSNKSSRFQIKKPDQPGSLPVLAPPSQQWGGSRMPPLGPSGTAQPSKPPTGPPSFRFNRFQGIVSQATSRKFRKLILDQCQQEFQNNNTDKDKFKELEDQVKEATDDKKKEQLKVELLEEARFQMRRRSLGNVRFIGELYKQQMLTPKIIVECVAMLLNTPDDENLECLCELLTTVGGKLDEQLREIEDRVQIIKSQSLPTQRLPKFIPEDKWMIKTITMLKHLSENKKLSSRTRFALLDAVELRDNNWKPTRDVNASETTEEVRRDAFKQEMEKKRQINSLPPLGTMGDQRIGPFRRQAPGSQPVKKGDWNTVQSNKSSRFQIKKPDQPRSLPVLDPPSQQWGRSPMPPLGPSGAAQPSKPPTGPPSSRFNRRFQGLSDDSSSSD